jgi:hypothetical protein
MINAIPFRFLLLLRLVLFIHLNPQRQFPHYYAVDCKAFKQSRRLRQILHTEGGCFAESLYNIKRQCQTSVRFTQELKPDSVQGTLASIRLRIVYLTVCSVGKNKAYKKMINKN